MDFGSRTLSLSEMVALLDTVEVVSSDGISFYVPRKALGHSRVLHEMEEILGPRHEAIPFPALDSSTLRIVAQWMWAHVDDCHEYICYERNDVAYVRNPEDTKLFGANGCDDLQRAKLVNAANYLDMPRFKDAVLAEISEIVKHLSFKTFLKRHNIGIDEAEEELRKLREEHHWFDL